MDALVLERTINGAYFRAGQPYKCQVAIVRVWSVAQVFSLRITRCDIWFQTGFHKLMCDVTLAVSVFYIWSVVVCKHLFTLFYVLINMLKC